MFVIQARVAERGWDGSCKEWGRDSSPAEGASQAKAQEPADAQ